MPLRGIGSVGISAFVFLIWFGLQDQLLSISVLCIISLSQAKTSDQQFRKVGRFFYSYGISLILWEFISNEEFPSILERSLPEVFCQCLFLRTERE